MSAKTIFQIVCMAALTGWSLLAQDLVKVEICEGMADEASWSFTPHAPSEVLSAKAFGFGMLPTRYTSKGIKTDRSGPFLFRASAWVKLPMGDQVLLLRARTGARVFVDDREVLAAPFPNFKADGHEEVPENPIALSPDIRYLRPGHFERVATFASDGAAHEFRLEALVGLKERRPELGEMVLAFAHAEGATFHLVAPSESDRVALTEDAFEGYLEKERVACRETDTRARRAAAGTQARVWNERHALARSMIPAAASGDSIDRFVEARLKRAKVPPAPLADDYTFVRRASLDTIGLIPPVEVVREFARNRAPDKRAKLVDQFLNHPGWADHWVSYWQDVLAENPGILKPMLNNTGPFRWWLHESFADNRPMDQFATELITMEGSKFYGGPAGFGMATDNDVPMAQKAQIVSQAFLGMQLQCARCHDAPHHAFLQKDLFSLAAMLKRQPETVPWTSSIPTNSHVNVGRKVKVTLPPGSKVIPAWPFQNLLAETELTALHLASTNDSREKLAALVTHPRNPRFARVLVNRLWKRYMGWGIVEPVDDWETAKPSHPELLHFLANELTRHDYDLKHVARLILNSRAYQREVRPEGSEEQSFEARLFASPARRRLTAEQIVDSLFFASGKPFGAEELNMDVDGRRPVKEFNNLGVPTRAWEFTSLSNERDRPALSIPHAQSLVDTLTTFGWRDSRQSPLSVRDDSANVLQPALLANGVLSHGRIARLSDDSALTELALSEQSLPQLVESLFLRFLSRPPTREEKSFFAEILRPGFSDRRNPEFAQAQHQKAGPVRAVSWANHLNPEATRIKQEQERSARQGDAPSLRLRPEWRERAEDAVWALVNSPEFVFVP